MFFHDRLTTRAAVHTSLPASMVSQIDPEPGNRSRAANQNGAECGGITITAMVTWWHRHTSSYSIWFDDYEIGCFSESCSSKELDLHGLIRFLECSWCPKYQNIPCASALTPAPTILSTFFTLIPFFQSPPLWLVSKNHPAYSLSVLRHCADCFHLFPSLKRCSFTDINPLRSFHLAEGPNVLKPASSVRRRRASTLQRARKIWLPQFIRWVPNALESQACQD